MSASRETKFPTAMEYEAYYDDLQSGGNRGGGIPRVFIGSPYQRGHGIGSFLGGLFRKILPYLSRGARVVGKEALRAGLNVIEDVENNTPMKEALKTRLKESRGNLKRKAEEKINSLMTGSGYKVSAKIPALQFPLGSLDTRLARTARRKPRQSSKRKSSKSKVRVRKSKKSTRKKKRKIRTAGRKIKTPSTTRRRRTSSKSRSVSDIFS